MDQTTTPTKPTKVNILSDIILKPVRLPSKSVHPNVPPLAPLSIKNNIAKGIVGTQNVSDSPIEESLKRKSVDNFTSHETAKKPKLKVKKKKDKIYLTEEETVFNYMTGTYVKVAKDEPIRDLTGFQEENAVIKDEITIHETVLMAPNTETGDIKDEPKEEPKEEIKLVTENKQVTTKLDDKKPSVTIDLTEDDDNAETTISSQNNIFIQNVLALQNAIALQSLVKLESDIKPPLQHLQNNVVIANQSSSLKNLQGNVIIKNPNAIFQNSVNIGNQCPSNAVTPSGINQPMILMVQNNSNYIVPQNTDCVKSPLQNNAQGKLFLIPNNLNTGTNVVLANQQSPSASNIMNLVLQTNQSPVKNVVSLPQQKKTSIMLPNNFLVNLVAQTNTNADNSNKTSGPVQQALLLPSPSAPRLSFDVSKNANSSSQNSNSSPPNIKNAFNYLQDFKISALNAASDSFGCETCAYKSSSKRGLILHIFDAHLKNDFALNLKCKVCNFETEFQGVMEKHDLGHGNGPQNQEKFDNVSLSNNVEIRIRPVQKVDNSVVQKEAISPNKDAIIDIIDLSDSDEGKPENSSEEIQIYRCFDCNFVTPTRQSLQNHAVRHVQSKFQCSKHSTIIAACPECEYKSCLLDLKKNMLDAHIKNQCQKSQGELFSSDSEHENTSELFKCFHCPHVSKTLRILKYHAVRHFGGTFECDIHRSKKCATCSKCIYEETLKSLAQTVNECTICGYKTLDKYKYNRHKNKKIQCSVLFKSPLKGSSIDTNKDNQSNKTLDAGGNTNVNSSNSVIGQKVGNRVRFEMLSSDTETEENAGNFKCFHCTYVITSRSLLKVHAIVHYRRPFQCSLHPTSTRNGCKQCLYKTVLDELNKEVRLCQYCGYKTLRRSSFERHSRKKQNCESYRRRLAAQVSTTESEKKIYKNPSNVLNDGINPQEGPSLRPDVLICAKCNFRTANIDVFTQHNESKCGNKFPNRPESTKRTITDTTLLNCFDCNGFCTADREKLKEHAVMHYKKKSFTCKNHSLSENDPNCGKCIYRSIKKDVEKHVRICKRCAFKTLDEDVFEKHMSSKNACKKKAGDEDGDDDDDDDDYIPDNDVDSEIDSGSENHDSSTVSSSNGGKSQPRIIPRTTLSVFECFDCDLLCANQYELETHVTTHPESTVKCHHPAFNRQCRKCVYERVVRKSLGNKMSCKCGFTCNTMEAIRNHAKSRANCDEFKASNKAFKCYDCEKEFNSRAQLWDHAARHQSDFRCADHQDGAESTCGKCLYAFIQTNIRHHYFRCYDCSYRIFNSELDLKDHIETKHEHSQFKCRSHQAASQDGCDQCLYAYIVLQTSKKLLYFCAACRGSEYPFASWKNLRTHISMKHLTSTIKCLCHVDSKMFHECHRCLFEKILVCLRSQVFKCLECPVNMLTKEQLEGHIRIVHQNSVFQCTKHSRGDIVENCDMCGYQSIVALMKNPVVSS